MRPSPMFANIGDSLHSYLLQLWLFQLLASVTDHAHDFWDVVVSTCSPARLIRSSEICFRSSFRWISDLSIVMKFGLKKTLTLSKVFGLPFLIYSYKAIKVL